MEKKIPMRQCLGCREMKPKRELIRVGRSSEGEISLDFRGKAPGRGAYVCPNSECLKKARKARALERAFSAQIPLEIYERLEADRFSSMALAEKTEYVARRLDGLAKLYDVPMATETARRIWTERLVFAEQFYKKLLSQLLTSEKLL